MKLKKILVPILVACTAATAAAGLAACNDGDDTPPTITYQFTGNFTNDTLRGYGFDYHIMLNLYSDGKVAGSGYNSLTMDNREASKNTGFGAKWFRGSWEDAKNEEDQDCVKIKAIYDSDAKNGMDGTALTNTSTYYVAKKSDGTLSNFKLQSPIFSGTNEYMTDMKQNKTPYDTADKFIQANLYEWTAPTGYEAVFETTSESQMTGKIYLMPDGVADVYSGKQVPDSTDYKFVKGETWSWSYYNGELIIGDYTAVVAESSATLDYTVAIYNNNMNYKYSCTDLSKLSEVKPVPKPIATLNATEGAYTVMFYADGTVKLTSQYLSPEWRWTYSNGAFTLKEKDKDDAPGGVTITMDGNTATLTYAPSFLQGASVVYKGDVSAIIAQ